MCIDIKDVILKMNIIRLDKLNKLYCEYMNIKINGYKFEIFLLDKKEITKKQLKNVISIKKRYESKNKYDRASANYELAECSSKSLLSYISSLSNT